MALFRSKNINMTEGNILPSIIRYSIPIVIGGVIQVLFNAADLAVVGNFSQSKTAAGAAVGATGSFTALIVNLFMGISVGVNVILARSLGSNDEERSQRIVHTAVLASVVGGLIIMGIGMPLSGFAMDRMGCPAESRDMAVQYLMIYFAGAPGILLYNVGAAIMRSNGDTQRPMIFLVIAGVLNVALNVVFVKFFYLEAAGVALATALTQYLSAFLTLRCLFRETDATRLEFKKLRIYGRELYDIIRYGVPSGATNCLFAISNLQIQSVINTYGIAAMNGNSASSSLESVFATVISAFSAATVAFTGQNIGAGKPDRVKKSIVTSLMVTVAFIFVTTWASSFLCSPLLGLYNSDPEVIEMGKIRYVILMRSYFICTAYNIINSASQAFGYSLPVMICSVFSIVGIRFLWMLTVYPKYQTFEMIYYCYTVSWTVNVIAALAVFMIAYSRYRKAGKTA